MTPRTLPLWLALVLALLCGALVATQSRINGELGSRLGDGFTAAAISFGSGLVILVVALAVAPAGRRGLARVREALRDRRLRWWYVCGGAAGTWTYLRYHNLSLWLAVALAAALVMAVRRLKPGSAREPSSDPPEA